MEEGEPWASRVLSGKAVVCEEWDWAGNGAGSRKPREPGGWVERRVGGPGLDPCVTEAWSRPAGGTEVVGNSASDLGPGGRGTCVL